MKRVVIVGAAGYSGAELTGLLTDHPESEVVGLFGSERPPGAAAPLFSDLHPQWRGLVDQPVQPIDRAALLDLDPDAVFLATPHEASHALAPVLVEAGITVVDLSGAFRLPDPSAYGTHYGFDHEHPGLLRSAAYGLPERHADEIRDADLIAVPGCYPTSIILPLAPLVDVGALNTTHLVVADSISGVSGAGRAPKLTSHFCEVSLQPYGVLSHRHTPEICAHSGAEVVFTPHLAPLDRGIVSTVHADVNPDWDEPSLREVLAAAYGDEPFVRLLPPQTWPSVAGVKHTNFCDIGLAFYAARRHLVVVSALDNLLKGAAGQAVQCFNLRFGYPSWCGLSGAVQTVTSQGCPT